MRRLFIATLLLLCAQFLAAQASSPINTIAGGGPNNLPATSASLNNPQAYAAGYIADESSRVYKVDPSTGNLTVVAGTGVWGYSGDGGPAVNASLGTLTSVAVDGSGNLYIGDDGNCVVREVTADGIIHTVAGSGTCTSSAGDGGPATSAVMSDVYALVLDSSGDLYIADTCSIREVSGGTINTVAGGALNCGYNGDGAALSTEIDLPQGLALDASDNLFFSDTGNHIVRELVVSTQQIQTVAGTAQTPGYSGDGGAAASAELCDPKGVALDAGGNLYIADTDNDVIREVSGGLISTYAGNGTWGYAGDGGPASSAEFVWPNGLWTDAAGDLFVADSSNNRIREISGSSINTYAGNGNALYSGDGYQATDAVIAWGGWFQHPAADSQGNLYIPDSVNGVVRKVDAVTGKISTFAGSATQPIQADAVLVGPAGIYIADMGNCVVDLIPSSGGNLQTIAGTAGTCSEGGDAGLATSAYLDYPAGLAMDGKGNLYIADLEGSTVRKVDAQTQYISTIASGFQAPAGIAFDFQGDLFIADFPASDVYEVTAAQLSSGAQNAQNLTPILSYANGMVEPMDVATDGNGDLFVADRWGSVVYKLDNSGSLSVIAGSVGSVGFAGDGGAATSALMGYPVGLAFDNASNLLVADAVDYEYGATRIRKISAPLPLAALSGTSLSWPVPQLVGSTGSTQSVTFSNAGYEPLTVGAVSVSSADFTIVSDGCSGQSLAAFGGNCTVSVAYAPTGTGPAHTTGTLTIPSNGGSPSVALSGSPVTSFALTPPPSTSATITAGGITNFELSVQQVAGLSAPIVFTCTGAPSVASCTVTPANGVIPTTGPAPVTVNVTTTAGTTTSASAKPHSSRPGEGSALVLTLALLLLPSRPSRRLVKRLCVAGLFTIALAAILFAAGCGNGSHSTGTGTGTGTANTGTPAGKYTLVVTGTSGSMIQSQKLILNVN